VGVVREHSGEFFDIAHTKSGKETFSTAIIMVRSCASSQGLGFARSLKP